MMNNLTLFCISWTKNWKNSEDHDSWVKNFMENFWNILWHFDYFFLFLKFLTTQILHENIHAQFSLITHRGVNLSLLYPRHLLFNFYFKNNYNEIINSEINLFIDAIFESSLYLVTFKFFAAKSHISRLIENRRSYKNENERKIPVWNWTV